MQLIEADVSCSTWNDNSRRSFSDEPNLLRHHQVTFRRLRRIIRTEAFSVLRSTRRLVPKTFSNDWPPLTNQEKVDIDGVRVLAFAIAILENDVLSCCVVELVAFERHDLDKPDHLSMTSKVRSTCGRSDLSRCSKTGESTDKF